MPFSGGTFTKLYNWLTDPQRNEKIFNSRLDDEFGGIATGLSTAILKDGTSITTAAIPFAQGLTVGSAGNIVVNTNKFIVAGSNGNTLIAGTGTVSGVLSAMGDFNVNTNKFNITASTGDTSLAGLLDISGSSAGQIKFPGTQNASSNVNTLDDYEEGTWTPTLSLSTPGTSSFSPSVAVGSYTKIGRLVTLQFLWVASGAGYSLGTGSGIISLGTLPFTSDSTSNRIHYGALSWQGVTKAGYTQAVARIAAGATTIDFAASGSGVGSLVLTAADTPTGGNVAFGGTINYVV